MPCICVLKYRGLLHKLHRACYKPLTPLPSPHCGPNLDQSVTSTNCRVGKGCVSGEKSRVHFMTHKILGAEGKALWREREEGEKTQQMTSSKSL